MTRNPNFHPIRDFAQRQRLDEWAAQAACDYHPCVRYDRPCAAVFKDSLAGFYAVTIPYISYSSDSRQRGVSSDG